MPKNNKVWEKHLADGASSSVDQESQKNTEATWDHYLHTSPNSSDYLEAVQDTVRKINGIPSDDLMEDLDVNVAIWGVFMDATLKTAVHLGSDHDVNLRHVRNSFWISLIENPLVRFPHCATLGTCQKVGYVVLKRPCFSSAFFSIFDEGGVCDPDTMAGGVAPSSDSLALLLQHVSTTPLCQSTIKNQKQRTH